MVGAKCQDGARDPCPFQITELGIIHWVIGKAESSISARPENQSYSGNYIVHKSQQTQTWMMQFGNRLVLHFLPPYSSEYMMIERLWKQMHDHVTRNHR
jgi:transposase